ncbi:Uncharacterised protein [Acinetobacter baumannii]|nr:Uncharacterised protein [Acinetobacter baumannii]
MLADDQTEYFLLHSPHLYNSHAIALQVLKAFFLYSRLLTCPLKQIKLFSSLLYTDYAAHIILNLADFAKILLICLYFCPTSIKNRDVFISVFSVLKAFRIASYRINLLLVLKIDLLPNTNGGSFDNATSVY